MKMGIKHLITRIKEYMVRYEVETYNPELYNLLKEILEEFYFYVAADETINEILKQGKMRYEVLKNE